MVRNGAIIGPVKKIEPAAISDIRNRPNFTDEWQLLAAEGVKQFGYTWDGFRHFANLMLYNPGEPDRFMEPAAHHEAWIRTMIENNRVCILAPPESAKTTYTMLLLAFTVGHKPATQSIVVSVSDAQAEDIVGAVMAHIEFNPAWKLCFPNVVPDKRRGWGYEKGFFVRKAGDYADWIRERGQRKDPSFIGVGYGNRAIIGKRVDGVLIVDDMMDEKNTASEAELTMAKNIFIKVISSRPTEEGKLILVGTPWREDDVYADAVATGLYRNFITPAWEEDERGNKTSYWPEVWPIERLERKRKEFGERDFQLMYLMDLKASKGQVLPETSLRPFFPVREVDPLWPEYWGVDVAISSQDFGFSNRGRKGYGKRSYFALAKIKAAPFGLVVTEIIRQQVSLGEAIELIRSHLQLSRPKKINVETWGIGQLLIQQLIREIEAPVFPYKDTKDKTARFSAMERHFAVNRIMVADNMTPGLKEFANEWIGYPSYPTNDTLDAVAAAIDAAGFKIYAGGRYVEKGEGSREMAFEVLSNPMSIPSSKFSGV